MKRFLVVIMLSLCMSATAQETSTLNTKQRTNISLGIGVGPSYGIAGLKMFVGSHNSGVNIGVGSLLGSTPSFSLGGQFGLSKGTYLSFNYGTAIITQVNNEPAEALTGAWALFGVKLAENDVLNLDFSVGHTFSVEKTEYFGISESNDGFTFNLGLNVYILK